MHARVHTYCRTYTHACTHTRAHTLAHTHVCAYIYMYIYVYIYIYIYIYIHVCTPASKTVARIAKPSSKTRFQNQFWNPVSESDFGNVLPVWQSSFGSRLWNIGPALELVFFSQGSHGPAMSVIIIPFIAVPFPLNARSIPCLWGKVSPSIISRNGATAWASIVQI